MPDSDETVETAGEEVVEATEENPSESPVDPKVEAAAISLPQLGTEDRSTVQQRLGAMMDVGVQVTAVIGQRELPLEQLLAVKIGTVVDLERLAGEPIELHVNGKPIALAEVVVADGRLAARVLERVSVGDSAETVTAESAETPSESPAEPAAPE